MATTPTVPPRTLAVIDIGSNSGRVVVYRYEVGGHLQIMAGSRASLRLVRDLEEGHRLTPEAMERAWEALRDFRAIAQGAGAERTVALATSAVRDAENGPALIDRIRQELGIEARVLSGEEEAQLGFLGAVRSLPVEHGVLFDLGGGSLQVSRFRQRRRMASLSLPLGALRLSDAFLKSDPPSAGQIRRLREHVAAQLERGGLAPLEPGEELVGTGGTMRNLARIDRQARDYPIRRLHGYKVPRRRIKEIAEELASLKLKKRERVPGLNDDRGDSVVGGSLAVLSLMELLSAPAVQVSGQGVREGLAVSLLAETLPGIEAVKESSLAALVSRFDGWDKEQAARRRFLAEGLWAALELRPRPELREALLQAAFVLDVGRSIDFFDRHEHVSEIVIATDLNGFSHRAIALLSALVRRAGDEETTAKAYAPLLKREDDPALARAAALLVLADDIEERCPRGVALSLDCQVGAEEVVVRVPALAGWRPRRVGPRFARAYGRKLVVTAG